jgi:hypothetical protein
MCSNRCDTKDDEPPILVLYRRFLSLKHLIGEVGSDPIRARQLSGEMERIISEVGTLFAETQLDFMAQSVMLSFGGKIGLTNGELNSYTHQMDTYVESEFEAGRHLDFVIKDEILRIWSRYHSLKPVPVGIKAGLKSPALV